MHGHMGSLRLESKHLLASICGLHFGCFLIKAYGIWAASGQIDIMEIRGQKLNVNQGSIDYGGS